MRLRLLCVFSLALLSFACKPSREPEWTKAMQAGAQAVQQGNYREGVAQYNTALAAVQTLPEDHRLTDTLVALAEAHVAVGELNEAEELYRRALPLQRQFHGTDSEQVATTLHNLGTLYQDVERFDEADAAYNEALIMRQKVLGPDNPDVATTLMHIASLRRQLKRDTEAEDLNKRALPMCQKAKDQRCLATVYDNLGALYFEKGRLNDAIDVFTKGRETWKALTGQESLDYAISTANLARAYQQMKKYKEAEPLLKEALPIFEMAYGEDNGELVGYYIGYAQLLENLNRRDEAEAFARKASALQALNLRR